MLQIVYISTVRQVFTEQELEELLEGARRNNRRAGVTGLLVAGGRRFLQALEGPEQAVVATMDLIKADPRHFGIVELARRAIDERVFGEWEMAFQKGGDPSDGDAAAVSLTELIKPIEDKTLHAQFAGFAQIHDRAA